MPSGSLMGTHMKPVVVATEDYSVTLMTLGDIGPEQRTYLLMEQLFMLTFGQGTVQVNLAHIQKRSMLQAVNVQ
jgi:hypothetical protein